MQSISTYLWSLNINNVDSSNEMPTILNVLEELLELIVLSSLNS